MISKGYEPLTDEEIRVVRESTLSFASSKTYDEDDQLRAEFERDRRWLATIDALRARAEAAEKALADIAEMPLADTCDCIRINTTFLCTCHRAIAKAALARARTDALGAGEGQPTC